MRLYRIAAFLTLAALTATGSASADDAKLKAGQLEKITQKRAEFVEAVFKRSDVDADGRMALAELQKLLRVFYEEIRDAGADTEKVQTVKSAHKYLVKMQWFLSADLDEDSVLTRAEFVALVGETLKEREVEVQSGIDAQEFDNTWPYVEEAMREELDAVWTLSDDDVEALIEDFKLRIRMGVTAYSDDLVLRRRSRGGKLEARLERQAQPFRKLVTLGVLRTRLSRMALGAYALEARKVAARRLEVWKVETTTRDWSEKGERWESDTHWSKTAYTWLDADKYEHISFCPAGDRASGNDRSGLGSLWRCSLSDDEKLRDKREYKFAGTSKVSESVSVVAGSFACTRFTAKLGSWSGDWWVADKYADKPVKVEMTAPDAKLLSQLVFVKETAER